MTTRVTGSRPSVACPWPVLCSLLVLTTSTIHVLAGPGRLVIYDICYPAPAAWDHQSVRPASPLA